MTLTQTKADVLAQISQFFLTGMSTYLLEFHGHADLLHISLPLFNFFTRGAFTNHGNPPACPLGDISGWTSLQILGGRGAAVVLTLADIGAQDSRLINADNLSRGAKVTLLVIFGLDNFCCKLGAFCYIIMGLFGCACPYVHELKILVN